MHNKFVEMIELHLEMFCKEHDTTAEKMFELLAEVNNSEEINQEVRQRRRAAATTSSSLQAV